MIKNLFFLLIAFFVCLPVKAKNKPTRPFDPLDVIAPLSPIQEGAEPDKAFDPYQVPLMAQGIILGFNHWPLSAQEQAQLDKILNPTKLKTTRKHPRFQSIVLSWEKLKKEEEALKVCQSLSQLLFLTWCETDSLVPPANIWKSVLSKLRNRFSKKNQSKIAQSPSSIGSYTADQSNYTANSNSYDRPRNPLPLDHKHYKAPSSGPRLQDNAIPQGASGNLKTCHIVPSQLGLEEGTLSDYWGQEMVGADLLREELKTAPPVKKNLVASFDSRHRRHDLGVLNLISGNGRQAVLPPSQHSDQQNVENIDVTYPSMYLGHADYYLSQINSACGPPLLRGGGQVDLSQNPSSFVGVNSQSYTNLWNSRRRNTSSTQNCRYIRVSGHRVLYCGSSSSSTCPFRRYDQYGHYVCVDTREDLYPNTNN